MKCILLILIPFLFAVNCRAGSTDTTAIEWYGLASSAYKKGDYLKALRGFMKSNEKFAINGYPYNTLN